MHKTKPILPNLQTKTHKTKSLNKNLYNKFLKQEPIKPNSQTFSWAYYFYNMQIDQIYKKEKTKWPSFFSAP